MTTQHKTLGSLMALGALTALASGAARADGSKSAATAEQHAALASKGDDVASVHQHLHHVLNCLVGKEGIGFDASAGNPCSATGAAIPETSDAKMKMKLQMAATEARAGLADDDYEAAKKAAMQVQMTLK